MEEGVEIMKNTCGKKLAKANLWSLGPFCVGAGSSLRFNHHGRDWDQPEGGNEPPEASFLKLHRKVKCHLSFRKVMRFQGMMVDLRWVGNPQAWSI